MPLDEKEMKQILTWLKCNVNSTEEGKVGVIFHIHGEKVSFEKIHNTKGSIKKGEKVHA